MSDDRPSPDPVGSSPTASKLVPPATQRRLSRLFHTESERLPASLSVRLMRWWIPGALCVIGIVLMVAEHFNGFGVSAFAAFVGAGASTWLANFLWRLGVSGDDERDREARDRAFLAQHRRWPSARESAYRTEHGHWPDEQSR